MKAALIAVAKSGPGNWVRRCEYFLFDAEHISFRPFVFFRFSIGTLAILQYLSMLPDVDYMFGAKNVLPVDVAALFVDDWIPTYYRISNWFGIDATYFKILFSSVYIAAGVALLTGQKTCWAAAILLLLHISLFSSNVFFMYGVDYFLRMSLFYLVFFPSRTNDSVGSSGGGRNFLIYRRFVQLHLGVVYLFSGVDKLIGYNWRNGEAVWKAVNLPHINTDFKIDFSWLGDLPILALLLGWCVLFVEIGYPLIFLPRFRKFVLFAVIAMHFGIALVMNLYFFSAIMIIWNLTAFFNFERSRRSPLIREVTDNYEPAVTNKHH